MEHRGAALPAIVLALLLAGCIGPAASEESILPCAATEGSPAPAYDAASLRGATMVRGFDVEETQARAMLALVASQLVTPGGAPYDKLDATLTRETVADDGSVATWRFAANASWSGGVDAFSLSLFQRGDVIGADFPDDVVVAPGWLRAEAARVADGLVEARAIAAGAPFVEARWFADAPGCVRLAHADASGAPAYVWVDVARGHLVAVTGGEALPGAPEAA